MRFSIFIAFEFVVSRSIAFPHDTSQSLSSLAESSEGKETTPRDNKPSMEYKDFLKQGQSVLCDENEHKLCCEFDAKLWGFGAHRCVECMLVIERRILRVLLTTTDAQNHLKMEFQDLCNNLVAHLKCCKVFERKKPTDKWGKGKKCIPGYYRRYKAGEPKYNAKSRVRVKNGERQGDGDIPAPAFAIPVLPSVEQPPRDRI